MHKVGDTFLGDFAKPDGLCDEAWKAMYQYVFALSHGSDIFYYGDWIDKPGVAICSCNNGIRPVILKFLLLMRFLYHPCYHKKYAMYYTTADVDPLLEKKKC